jgi:hypothetical protein
MTKMKKNPWWGASKDFGDFFCTQGTYWEPDGNLKGTKENEKKSRYFECMLSLPIDCMKFLFSKLFITIFGLG